MKKIQKTIGNLIRTFEVQDKSDLDEFDPWSGVLVAVVFNVRYTVHITTKETPKHLLY